MIKGTKTDNPAFPSTFNAKCLHIMEHDPQSLYESLVIDSKMLENFTVFSSLGFTSLHQNHQLSTVNLHLKDSKGSLKNLKCIILTLF